MTVANLDPGFFDLHGIDIAAYGGKNLTAKELEMILDRCSQMFTSNGTTDGLKDAIEDLKSATGAMTLMFSRIQANNNEHEVRIRIIEECHKEQRRMLNVKIAAAALFVSLVAKGDVIINAIIKWLR